ncbi:MAG: AbrB/MazE/SpoVT family DNA-binding domain-containing protein [Bacillota bacterium]|nr:AbrB/MazE/SpoVT family DNA-binding domain-containing protein [Bacillota bacterium]
MAPKGKHIFGTVKVGEKGQIVIPKEARDIFNIKPGDTLLVLGDEAQGLAIVKNNVFMELVDKILSSPKASKHEKEFANDVLDSQDKKEE